MLKGVIIIFDVIRQKKTILLKYIYIVDRNISFPNYLFYVYKNKFKKRRETTLKFLIKSSIFFLKVSGWILVDLINLGRMKYKANFGRI